MLWNEAAIGFERLFGAAAGFETWRSKGALLAMSGASPPDLNCGIVTAGDHAPAAIREMANRLRHRRLSGLVLVTDGAGAAAVQAATEVGLVPAARMPLMSLPAAAVVADPGTFTVRRVTTAADLAVANGLMAAAFDLAVEHLAAAFPPRLLAEPAVEVDLVLDGHEPVGAVQTTTHGGIVGVWSMATPPTQRRRGIARAGLTHAIAERHRGGAHTVFLIATDAGRPLYDAVGFGVVDWCTAWLATPHAKHGPMTTA